MNKILFITIDCARQDAIYGNMADTPNIDQLRNDSVTFTEAFSQTNSTKLSLASIFTSWYLSDLNMYEGSAKIRNLPNHYLIKYLKDKGWQTNAVCSLLDFPGFQNKFQKSNLLYRIRQQFSMRRAKMLTNSLKLIMGKYSRQNLDKISPLNKSLRSYNAKMATEKALDFMREGLDKTFSWIHYFDAHFPNHLLLYQENCPVNFINKFGGLSRFMSMNQASESEQKTICDSYCMAITRIDQAIGSIINYLKEKNEYDEYLIILAADHGDNMLENDLYYGHFHLFDSVTKVPLIIKFPHNKYKNKTYDKIVELVDLYPTILSVYEYECPNNMIRGINLLDLLAGDKNSFDRFSICEHEIGYQASIRDEKWQYIQTMSPKDWITKGDNYLCTVGQLINREGPKLLKRMENGCHNYLHHFPDEVRRLKKQLYLILESRF